MEQKTRLSVECLHAPETKDRVHDFCLPYTYYLYRAFLKMPNKTNQVIITHENKRGSDSVT